MNYELKCLVERSILHDEIVHARYTDELYGTLLVACDDCVENGQVVEFWGANDDDWRIHLDLDEEENDAC
jgi:hypothetical protein